MKKKYQQMMKNEKGLTLVELLAVVVILGIIAAIAVPSIGNIIENSRVKAIKADALMVLSAADMYFIENPPTVATDDSGANNPVSVKTLKEEGFLDDEASFEGTAANAKVAYFADGNKFTGTGKNANVVLEFEEATKSDINDATKVENGEKIPLDEAGS